MYHQVYHLGVSPCDLWTDTESSKAKQNWKRCACRLKYNAYCTFQHTSSILNKIIIIDINHNIQNVELFHMSIESCSFSFRINSYFICAYIKITVAFLSIDDICQILQKIQLLFPYRVPLQLHLNVWTVRTYL